MLQTFTVLFFNSYFLIQILKLDIYSKYILLKRNCCTLTPSYIGNVSFSTVTMAINSLYFLLLHFMFAYPASATKISPFIRQFFRHARPGRLGEGGWENATTFHVTPQTHTHTHTQTLGRGPQVNFFVGTRAHLPSQESPFVCVLA